MERHPVATRALLALTVTAGWVCFDLALFATSTEPRLALALVPGSLVALLAAAVAGALLGRWPSALPLALLVALAASVAGRFWDGPTGAVWLPRVAALQLLALLLASRDRRPALALGGGVLGAALVCAFRLGQLPHGAWVLVAGALALLGLAFVRKASARRASALVVLVAVALGLVLLGLGATGLRRPDLEPVAAPDPGAPNLLLIVLDTVRADHLAPYGHERVTTPALDAFVAEHTVRYETARSTSSWTLPAHASLFTGLFPDQHGATRPRSVHDDATVTLQAWPAQALRPDVQTLASILRSRGYQTAALLGNVSFLRHEYGLDRGFERYDDRKNAWMPDALPLARLFGARPRVGFLPYREGRTIADLALGWLSGERRDQPFFLALNFMDAHAPYIAPPPYDRAFEGPVPADPRDPPDALRPLLYDRELAYLDSQVARVLARLEQLGLFERTVVIVTSDHGEGFGEHGLWLHGWSLHEETVRVPLYVKPLGRGSPGTRPEPVTGADVFGIALRELGLEPPLAGPPQPGMIGQLYLTEFLREHWRGRGVELDLGQIAWTEDGTKLLVGRSGPVQAFDLALDPGEQTPLPLGSAAVEAARATAAAWWSQHPPIVTGVPVADEAELERLRGLGYTGDE